MDNNNEIPANEPPITEINETDLRFLSNDRYYQSEFKKIVESGENYKGSWNWGAFLFTSLWCFSKGCWEVGLEMFVGYIAACFFDPTVALFWGFGCMILMGKRGTWILYNVKKKKNFPG